MSRRCPDNGKIPGAMASVDQIGAALTEKISRLVNQGIEDALSGNCYAPSLPSPYGPAWTAWTSLTRNPEQNDPRFTRITHEELNSLRQTSAKVQKLAEGHGRLSDELEVARAAAARVERLEKENKRLSQELRDRIQQKCTPILKSIVGLQHGSELSLTPRSGDPPSSFQLITPGVADPLVTKKKYEDLVRKYNSVCATYLSVKGEYEKTKKVLKDERNKWDVWLEENQKATEKKKDKVRRLEGEIKGLKTVLKKQGIKSIEFAANLPRDESTPCKPPPQQKHRGSEVQVPASSPPRTSRGLGGQIQDSSKGTSTRLTENDGNQLPPFRDDADALEMVYEPLEVHETSSTQSGSDPFLPEEALGENSVDVAEPIVDTTSSPVLLSSRSVRKRKQLHEDPEETPRGKIKVEALSSSSPICDPTGPGTWILQESMDLDDVGEKVDTPKRPTRVLPLSWQESTSSTSSRDFTQSPSQPGRRTHTSAATPENFAQATSNYRKTKAVLQPRSSNQRVLPRTSDDRIPAPKKQKATSYIDIGGVAEDGEPDFGPQGATRQTNKDSRFLEKLLAGPSPSKAVINPVQVFRSANQPVKSPGVKARPGYPATSALAVKIGSIDHPESENTNLIRVSPEPSRQCSITSRKSPALKSQESMSSARPSPELFPLAPESSKPSSIPSPRTLIKPIQSEVKLLSTPPKAETERAEGTTRRRSPSFDSTPLQPRRDLDALFSAKSEPRFLLSTVKPSPRPGTSSKSGTPRKRQALTERDYPIDPDQEPLRSRPLHKLSARDFKINPNYNQGIKHQFSEVVRGEARKCLQGCIKPDCCGRKFRALAQIEVERLASVGSLSQEERDDMLLQEFMGDNAHKIQKLGKTEREALLLEATTRNMANMYGKHRHTYERRSTPPGFWNVDFPSTQEEAEDRRKAKENERATTEQRYKEAMRPGGAWMFRDEEPSS
ncbi:hypothetical protein QTJ16_005294 [Diplocarpon rosae]|uniref:DNA endonuclease activator Ctp1 C-terminal domain-containing protein n=1 Tax=Diplocarpon rosae TaxID=946125 RepID=A0AAD9SWG0_9HELO|nr:hypothetical protein QTJ16_005294 [Diplocarpon rosae]